MALPDPGVLAAVAAAALILGVVLFLVLRRAVRPSAVAELAQITERLALGQEQIVGRLKQLSETGAARDAHFADRLQAQERALAKALDERLGDVARRVGETLQQTSERSTETITRLNERLAVIDAAQKNITDLSAQVVELQDVLTNRQVRGAFGEIQLNDLVRGALPPAAYEFQATLGNGKRADCLIRLPNPPGSIAIDAKFPLDSYRGLRAVEDEAARREAGRAFAADVLRHVNDIATKYIVPGETAESALMFLPAEAVYAELHANFSDVVEKSHRQRVWIVSPTTLMATLTTVRAILKDARMREQAGLIQGEVKKLLEDVQRLDKRVENLQRHFDAAVGDMREIRVSSEKLTRRAERIEEVDLGETPVAVAAPEPALRIETGSG